MTWNSQRVYSYTTHETTIDTTLTHIIYIEYSRKIFTHNNHTNQSQRSQTSMFCLFWHKLWNKKGKLTQYKHGGCVKWQETWNSKQKQLNPRDAVVNNWRRFRKLQLKVLTKLRNKRNLYKRTGSQTRYVRITFVKSAL